MRAVNSLRQYLPSAGQNKVEGLIASNDDEDEVWRKLPSKDTNRTAHWCNGNMVKPHQRKFGAGHVAINDHLCSKTKALTRSREQLCSWNPTCQVYPRRTNKGRAIDTRICGIYATTHEMCPVMLKKVGFCDTSDEESDVKGRWTQNMSLGPRIGSNNRNGAFRLIHFTVSEGIERILV
jgi:hypothetical protein